MGQPAAEPAALNEEELYYTDLSVGEILRRARLHYGQSLPDIEQNLRIRASQIEAIELGDMERLPGRVYAIGFVRSYAEYLRLDGDKMVSLFKAQYGRSSSDPELDFPVAASESKIPSPWLVSGSFAVAVLIGIFIWVSQTGSRDLVQDVPPVSEVLDNVSVDGEIYGPFMPKGYDPQAEVKSVEALAQQGIILTITENSWVEIKDQSGKTLVSQVLKAGDKYLVPSDRTGLSMSLGNAAGVALSLDGQALSPLGAKGQVVRDLPLDVVYLKERYAPAP